MQRSIPRATTIDSEPTVNVPNHFLCVFANRWLPWAAQATRKFMRAWGTEVTVTAAVADNTV